MFDRIIVAVDGSEEARAAATAGFDLAETVGAPVDVIHVIEGTVLDSLRSETDREGGREHSETLLDEVAARGVDRGLEVSRSVLEGRPGRQIASYAGKRPGTVVVLGRQGRSAVSERLLGGVTERVLGRGTAPVLVHPGTAAASNTVAGPLLVPTDGSENARKAYPYATGLAATLGASIHLLGVVDLQEAGGVFDAGGLNSERLKGLEADWISLLAEEREVISTRGTGRNAVEIAVRRTEDFEGVSGAIQAYAAEAGVGSVLMGSHGRSNVGQQLLGSVTRLLLRQTEVPILVVPRES